MKISSISAYNPINFYGKKSKNRKIREERNIEYKTIPVQYNPVNPNTLYSIQKNKMCKVEKHFDMNEILSLEVPKTKIKKPVSFANSDAKLVLDKYQKEAIDSFNSGNTTIVAAPTGTGKTLIAEYAIDNALKNNEKIIYLSPLKALSNEKYTEFAKLFGNYDENGNLVDTKNVGLVTGDVSINPKAPVLVMTTEVYRNSLLQADKEGAKEKYKDYSGVIYDEFHYLGEKDRGTVWEESVIYTPDHMKQLMLSATASNADKITDWIQDINGSIKAHLVNVPESERHVPLVEYVITNDTGGALKLEKTKKQRICPANLTDKTKMSEGQLESFKELSNIIGAKKDDDVLDYFKNKFKNQNTIKTEDFAKSLEENFKIDPIKAYSISLSLSDRNMTGYKKTPEHEPASGVTVAQTIKLLDDEKMTPALFYIFSKKGCNNHLDNIAKYSESLLTPEESKMVYDEVKKCQEEGIYLGADFDDSQLEALMKGYAVHHAGKLPAYKSLIENLARRGLVKVCLATETLLAGINMPFKTTVFTSLEKYQDGEIVDISTSTFKQGAGRAGRRGKDLIGNVVVTAPDYEEYEKYVELSSSMDTGVYSKFKPSYASILSDRMLNSKDEAMQRTLMAHQSQNKLNKVNAIVDNKIALLKSLGYIEENEDGSLIRTEKGEIAKKVYGINEILLTEFLTDKKFLEDFTAIELIALAASFSDVKDEQPSRDLKSDFEYMRKRLNLAFDMADLVNNTEEMMYIDNEPIESSTTLVPYIIQFANASKDRHEALDCWTNIMTKLRENELLTHEGDFLRLINGTIDILKLIVELSPDKNIKEEAKSAIDMLRKAPVQDIYNYELGIKN